MFVFWLIILIMVIALIRVSYIIGKGAYEVEEHIRKNEQAIEQIEQQLRERME